HRVIQRDRGISLGETPTLKEALEPDGLVARRGPSLLSPITASFNWAKVQNDEMLTATGSFARWSP
ncbi:hypothetical protein, partial [Rhizobium sp. SEMIA 4085]|uniref:hypothetical protein n=1 Tax=Rhizobium sp. SEMIA 4085 TaxID=2137761 RepID=UPI001AED51D0